MKKITRLNPDYRKAQKQSGSSELSGKLAAALEYFISSPAYVTLANLPLRVFADSEMVKVFPDTDFNFSDLVRLGSREIGRLCSNSPDLIARFAKLLDKLSGVGGGVAEVHTLFAKPATVDETVEPSHILLQEKPILEQPVRSPVQARLDSLSSVAAEQLLLDGQVRLREHSAFNEFSARMLKEYWPASLPVAPFIDALTFNQLAEMPVEHLLEKRTFSEQKVRAVLGCIECVCAAYQNPPISKMYPQAAYKSNDLSQFNLGRLAGSLELQAFSALIHLAKERLQNFWWARIFLEAITLEQAAILLVSQNMHGDSGATSSATMNSHKKEAGINRKLGQALKKNAGIQVKQWLGLLELAAVPLSAFDLPDTDNSLESIERAVLSACLRSIGAKPLRIGDYQNNFYWTANQNLHTYIQQRLRKLSKARKSKELLGVARSYFPQLPERELKCLLRSL